VSAQGRVAGLFRYPVKSMDGESHERMPVGADGFPGDRGWALIERATGKAMSAKRHAPLMLCRSRFLDEPGLGLPPPPAEVILPDGTVTRTDDPAAGALLSRLLGVECAFGRRPDGKGYFDDKPLHILTTATLETMRASSGLDFDARRFRPNVLIELGGQGRPEHEWVGKSVRVGTIRLRVLKPVKRCVMTTLPQPSLPAARGILPAVAALDARLGVYATADRDGALALGEAVSVSA
jgi:uncharacterized protein YcbX